MKYLFKSLAFASLCLLLNCCAPLRDGFAPRDIKKRTISFFVDREAGLFDRDIDRKTVYFTFRDDGDYFAKLDGNFFQAGDFVYRKINADSAKLVVTYSIDNDVFEYFFKLSFKDATSGVWTGYNHQNKGIDGDEGGTFQFQN